VNSGSSSQAVTPPAPKGRARKQFRLVVSGLARGLADLRRAGRFTVTDRLTEAVVAIQREASPLLAFTQDCLAVQPAYNPNLPNVRTLDADLWAKKDDIWRAYMRWCEENGRDTGHRGWFFRDLRSLLPKVSKQREKKKIDCKEVGKLLRAAVPRSQEAPARGGSPRATGQTRGRGCR
jgi:phage/plasmid-associated DNA primase